jgi:hypothetical protein
MAFTLVDFIGFETGGLEESDTTTGSPSVSASTVRTGSYSLLLAGAATAPLYQTGIDIPVTDHGLGFGVFFNDVTPTNDVDFLVLSALDDTVLVRLRIEATSGDFILVDDTATEVDSAAAPFTANKWHYIEIYVDAHASTGTAEVYLDGASVLTMTNANTANREAKFQGGTQSGEDIYIDDYYMGGMSVGVSDFLGIRTEVLGAYQNTAEDATDQGSTLVNGTWANVGQTPFSDGTVADYQSSPALAGYTICDEGNRAGPAGDAPGTIKGAKYIHRMARTNGSSPTTLDKSYGNSGDGVTSKDMAAALLVTYANFFEVSEAASVVPTNSENFAFGMGQTGTGGRDVLAHEMCAMLLHVQPALSTTLADLNFPDQNYYLGPFGT